MIVGGFAMLAVVPVVVVVVGVLRDVRVRALRGWAAALAVAYATPLALWAIGPERAPSLTRDMHPALAALIVAVSVGLLVALVLRARVARPGERGHAGARRPGPRRSLSS